jgi:hypothetical protein
MAGLVAPRALFVENGTEDNIFPLAAFQRAVTRAEEIYAAFGAPERFGSEVFEGDHHFHGAGAFRFLERALRSARERLEGVSVPLPTNRARKSPSHESRSPSPGTCT